MRTLKPSFFTNDQLADVAVLGRLLFQGLWCIADREGRLYDRPRRIKAEVLPYDDCDVDALLGELERHGFIQRYDTAAGEACIQVVNFGKHQNPHVKEPPSHIPPPPENGTAPTQHQPSTGQAPDEHHPFPAGMRHESWGVGHESQEQEQDSPAPTALARQPSRVVSITAGYSSDFDHFWTNYPRKLEKRAGWLEWQKRLKSGTDATSMIAAAGHYAAYHAEQATEDKYIAHASTFLGRQGKFEDYVAGVPRAGPSRAALPKGLSDVMAAVSRFEESA